MSNSYDLYSALAVAASRTPVDVALFDETETLQVFGDLEEYDSSYGVDFIFAVGGQSEAPNDITWGVIAGDWRFGCQDCLTASVEHIKYFYGDDIAPCFTQDQASVALSALWNHHGLPFALTNCDVDQNWSLVMPIADCNRCRSGNRSRTAIEGLLSSSARQSTNSAPTASDPEDTGGARALSADEFIDTNRLAIGFASIIGNPVLVDEEDQASLVNAHIRTSKDPVQCEIAGGKGLWESQAIASCLGEGIERYFLTTVSRGETVVGPSSSGSLNVSHVAPSEFGFPVNDLHPSLSVWEPGMPIEWSLAEEFQNGGERNSSLVPSNLVHCPYIPVPPARTISTGSTNGVATGASIDDATLQGLLELLERDAFWFYARTGQRVRPLEHQEVPTNIHEAMASFPGTFYAHELPNPFGVPVVQVTYVAPTGGDGSATARGTGATELLARSVSRAFAECMQMFHSLSSGIEVSPDPNDMRHIWYTGEVLDKLPNFFCNDLVPPENHSPTKVREVSVPRIAESARAQGMRVFRVILADTTNFAVVRSLITGISIMDATYFKDSNRLQSFAQHLGLPEPDIKYFDSLSM